MTTNKEHLYVCHFSNGHIKVGRSIDPISRIASHADRVSCMGVQLIEKHIVECKGNVILAEANLIGKACELSVERFANEWFTGLDYLEICEIADECAAYTEQFEPVNEWADYVKQIIASGWTQREIASRVGCAQPSIAKIVSGRTVDPSFSVGYGLLLIGRSLGLSDPSCVIAMVAA